MTAADTGVDLLLVDGNNLAWRAFSVLPELSSGGHLTGAVFGSLRMLRATVEKFRPKQVVVCWDEGGSVVRKTIYPAYKANRGDRDPERYRQFRWQEFKLRRMFIALGVPSWSSPGIEADDLIAVLVRENRRKRIVIVSGDRDFYQLVSGSVAVYSPYQDKEVSPMTLEWASGWCNPTQLIAAKILIGDKSDNVPGVGGIGPVKAKKLVEGSAVSLRDYAGAVDLRAVGRFIGGLDDQKQVAARRNLRLFYLGHLHGGVSNALSASKKSPEPDFAEFQRICVALKFNTIVKEGPRWTLPFARMSLLSLMRGKR